MTKHYNADIVLVRAPAVSGVACSYRRISTELAGGREVLPDAVGVAVRIVF